ncbi:MAG: DUF192 domain-containing protein [Candidatus Protistobacter heckmanni]|nr:DUF192 domain-containing protein [Candidatus Protistobacter heckmanni]
MFLLVLAWLGLHYVFRGGELIHEKTRILNTADATAYSAGVLGARLLNAQSYANRALAANEISLAQLSSLASWGRYAQEAGKNYRKGDPSAGEMLGLGFFRYTPLAVAPATHWTASAERHLETISSAAVGHEGAKRLLITAQAQADAAFPGARQRLQRDLLAANLGDSPDYVPYSYHMNRQFQGLTEDDAQGALEDAFTERYAGAGRRRMADLIVAAAGRDGFVRSRGWMEIGASVCTRVPVINVLTRSGGTRLAEDMSGWRAEDKLSLFAFKHGIPGLSTLREGTVENLSTGIPEHYDLSKKALDKRTPFYYWRAGINRHLSSLLPGAGGADPDGQAAPAARFDIYRPEASTLTPCKGVHMFGMRYGLDIVYLDTDLEGMRRGELGWVLKCVPDLRPWRLSACPGAGSVLELHTGEIFRLGLRKGMACAPVDSGADARPC